MRKDIMAFFSWPDIRGNGRGTVYEKVGNGGSLFFNDFSSAWPGGRSGKTKDRH